MVKYSAPKSNHLINSSSQNFFCSFEEKLRALFFPISAHKHIAKYMLLFLIQLEDTKVGEKTH